VHSQVNERVRDAEIRKCGCSIHKLQKAVVGEEKRRQKGSESMKLSLRQKFVLLVKGSVFLRFEKREGWSGYLPIFAVKCPIHGLYSGAQHGISNSPPQCPKCLEEAVEAEKKMRRTSIGL